MAIDLKGEQKRRFRDALTRAFGSYSKLNMMVTIELDEKLANITPQAPLPEVALELIEWANENSRVDELLLATLKERPRDKALAALAQELALTSQAEPKEELAGRFEAMFLKGAGLQHVAEWRARMETAERSVCRIDRDRGNDNFEGIGTGFLVGPDLILTNEHVADALKGRGGRALFDHKTDASFTTVSSRPAALATNWLLAESNRYKLDYALIKLAEPVGDDDVNGKPRGYLIPEVLDIPAESPLFILQHPSGELMRVCVGAAKPSTEPHYIHYTTNTEPGSSGSPVFTIDWRLVALHHFADRTLKQNRGIRMQQILAELKNKLPDMQTAV